MPVLDLLERHPTWTLSLEMQGYLVEVLLARHREVAQQLADLVAGGQVELLSFHYSDQLFLAHGQDQMAWSRALNHDVLANGCIVPSDPVFTQEGQFGEGMPAFMGGGVALIPKNLFRHFQGDGDVLPLYQSHGVDVVVGGRGVNDMASGFETQWVYMDDAELLATGGVNPYFPDVFVADPAKVAEFETRLEGLEADGWAIAGISDYVATLDEAGVLPAPLPAVLDGTWQPDDTKNLARWMGDGGLFKPTERDNLVLTQVSRATQMVKAAGAIAEVARSASVLTAAQDRELARARRDLLLGSVSDATGWNPISNEVEYSLWHTDAAWTRAHALALDVAAALGTSAPFTVDTEDGTMTPGAPTTPAMEAVSDPPITLTTEGGMRDATVTWQRYADEPDHYVVSIDWSVAYGEISATWPWTTESVRYTPALLDGTLAEVPLAELAFTETAIPLGSGPFALDDTTWLVLDTTRVHLAARLDRAAETVTFYDETLPREVGDTWRFHVVVGDADRALAVADRVLLHPIVTVEADAP